MIVPMKKAVVMVQSKDAESAVEALRLLGVVHVEHQTSPKGRDIASLGDDIALIDRVIAILSSPEFRAKYVSAETGAIPDWRAMARRIVDMQARHEQLEGYARNIRNSISQWEDWGDFDPDALKALSQKGVYLKLCRIPAKEAQAVKGDFIVKTISSKNGMANLAVISEGEIDLPFKWIEPPKAGLDKMRARLAEDESVMESIKADLGRHVIYRGRFAAIRRAFLRELEFHEALRGMGSSGAISYLAGYVPRDRAHVLEEAAAANSWGVLITDPSDEDNVPTYIRNPGWVSIISPVFRLIGVVPGYHELDISVFFLIFLSIFFGMLVGDAGYGMIFFILTGLAQIKFGPRTKEKSIFFLFYLFSLCAVVWGLFTGTFFGQEWIRPYFKPLMPILQKDKFVQSLCFFIAAVHLSIGHLWRGAVKLPSLGALSDFGWISILWGGFFLARTLIMGAAFPVFGKWLFIFGALLVVLFTSAKKNVFRAAGEGLGALALNVVNSFTDIVSYIRLFAVGLATVAIADSFNDMAAGIGYGSFPAGLLMALVLVVGHGLNIMLGPMSVLVHGVRLNVLEFCNHVDVKWSGFSYKPLSKADL